MLVKLRWNFISGPRCYAYCELCYSVRMKHGDDICRPSGFHGNNFVLFLFVHCTTKPGFL
uniref:Uncharacterized protein n=1 Tax=Aegilops tauschii subsp. strangulata TaxID=200361 RepID=A0A453ISI4_AEGTS